LGAGSPPARAAAAQLAPDNLDMRSLPTLDWQAPQLNGLEPSDDYQARYAGRPSKVARPTPLSR